MKKLIYALIITIILCSTIYFLDQKPLITNKETTELRGVFISYIDYQPLLLDKSQKEQQNAIDEMITNIKNMNLNTIFLQVVPFGDAIYKSQIYPVSKTISSNNILNLDILKYFIQVSHKQNIKVHAWLNPYRLQSNKEKIPTDAIYYSWFDTNKIESGKNGNYLNPASLEVLALIKSVVREIVYNYDVDGIMYDDYFYPSDTIDLENYSEFKINNDDISIEEFRINNIKKLIKETYKTVKETKKNVKFGISPSGNINNNIKNEYLDVETITKEEGYIDYIAPQIYYGFQNEVAPFITTVKTWSNLIKIDIDYYISLALYKSGLYDQYAKSGSEEWIDNTDIIKKQIIIARNDNKYKGFIIFRYEYLFNSERQNENTILETIALKEMLTSSNEKT